MADEVEVRRATADDVDVLVELRAEMFRSMGSAGVDGPWQQASRQWFAERLDHADYGIFVVTAAGQVVASAVGSARDCAPSPSVPEGRDVLISTVCTFPEWRGRGHGQRAFDAVLDWASVPRTWFPPIGWRSSEQRLAELPRSAVTTDAPGMAATLEFGTQERIDNIQRQTFAHHPHAHRQHVGIIVLADHPGRKRIHANPAADALDLVRRHHDALPCATQHNAKPAIARSHPPRCRLAMFGVMRAFRCDRPDINHLPTLRRDMRAHRLPQRNRGMVAGQNDALGRGIG